MARASARFCLRERRAQPVCRAFRCRTTCQIKLDAPVGVDGVASAPSAAYAVEKERLRFDQRA